MIFTTFEQAKKYADMENMGLDYGTAVVFKDGQNFIVKIK